ncbi:hypothetical protein ABZS83_31145 [Streptomyces sp. NPDC005426]|uniref:cyanase n=1 Tax=Streptomyces sp. NPDC005426 TaxID=3155344 RepID=UPI0033BB0E40
MTAACLGQMTFSKDQAEGIVSIFELPVEAVTVLQTPPTRGPNATAVAGDPVISRLREIVADYGPAIRELIHEEFGDGIMSAIDFRLSLDRRADPGGDHRTRPQRKVPALSDRLNRARCVRRARGAHEALAIPLPNHASATGSG